MKPRCYGPFPFLPINQRPKLTFPGDARVALWVIPNLEFYPLDAALRAQPNIIPNVAGWAYRDYGARVGVWRLMEVLSRHGIRGYGGHFMRPKFRGIYIPLITTFTEDGEVDYKIVGELTEFEINAGVHGLFVLGSTGMGPVMTTKQRIETAEFVVKQVKGRVPIIMHVGTADLQTTVELARHAEGLGVDAVAVVPPFYFTDHTPWEISAHYKAVAGAIKRPLFLYDNVRYSGYRFTPASVKKLAIEVPSLCGMKASYYPQAQLLEYLDVMPEDFAVMSGNTIDLLPAAPHGLSGAIPPPTAHVPELIVALWNAIEAKKYPDRPRDSAFQTHVNIRPRAAYLAVFSKKQYQEVFDHETPVLWPISLFADKPEAQADLPR